MSCVYEEGDTCHKSMSCVLPVSWRGWQGVVVSTSTSLSKSSLEESAQLQRHLNHSASTKKRAGAAERSAIRRAKLYRLHVDPGWSLLLPPPPPPSTRMHTHADIQYRCISSVCVCVCVCVQFNLLLFSGVLPQRERERERERGV